eukprot:comp12475_c0_seq1/m.7415 comp12475_c0_seq1/g.7415  ORF comp12475_c0_seq1/g.7415 comp12475_c0_seq1/m.7415 type:complete len:317 (-) comp12475_c0_seq1:384-1334(-)
MAATGAPYNPMFAQAPRPAPAEAPKKKWSDLDLPYPGPFEMLHQDVKTMLANAYLIDGLKFATSKPLSNQFQVSHTITMGGTPAMHFGATYVGNFNPNSPDAASPVLVSDIDTEGNLMAQVHYNITRALRGKFVYQTAGKAEVKTFELGYKGKDFDANVKLINPDLMTESGSLVASYFQSITKNFALGGEMLYQFHGGMEEAGLSFAGRYRGEKGSFTLNASPMGTLMASYLHRINEKVSLGTEIEANIATKDSLVSVGYQFDLRSQCVRGQVDSKGVISAVVENKMGPALSLVLTGSLDHVTGKSFFGIGFMLGA